jgi:hypothetical protein
MMGKREVRAIIVGLIASLSASGALAESRPQPTSEQQTETSIKSAPGHWALGAPDWEHYRNPYVPFMVTIGDYPVTALAGGNTVGTTHAITGAVTIPASPRVNKLAGFAAGVAGYGRSFNGRFSNQGGVGLYGAGLAAANETSAWGANVIVANLSDLSEPQLGRGQNNINLWGLEIDMNVQATTTGTPGGNATGLDLVGNSAVQPKGEFKAIRIQPAGLYAGVPWKSGLAIEDGAAETAMIIGRKDLVGASVSQPILFRGRTAHGQDREGAIRLDPDGNLLFTPTAGANVVATRSDLTTALSAGDAGVFLSLDGRAAKRVTYGSPDSCGRGYRCLRIEN